MCVTENGDVTKMVSVGLEKCRQFHKTALEQVKGRTCKLGNGLNKGNATTAPTFLGS